ncbi:isopeptide-forming domain-containing fimbrial protein [Bacillus cereus]|uniref:isopeptide-forming domain-containing fimbrial protein n=1 Tax=Bacillus cereus TaxID=1396 RepID=UPI000BF4C26B|nr:isopeptide-forming domain-containing fimbrial protein [Bacillus cereus]PEQ65029.1 hypothetical protein CN469_12705 [Bacillus cereus]
MLHNNLINKKNGRGLKKALVLFLTFLIVFSGILPNGLPTRVNAETRADTAGVCSQQQNVVALTNGSFEQPNVQILGTTMPRDTDVPGWRTTDSTGVIEIWRPKDGLPRGGWNRSPAVVGEQYAELNAYNAGLLYQDIKTTPGQKLYWRLYHMGRSGVDTMRLRIGPIGNTPQDTPEVQKMSDGVNNWGYYEGTYTVPAGQTTTRFGFESVSSANGDNSYGNFLDGIFLGTGPCVAATKSVDKDNSIYAGDELTYTVNVKNYGGDIAADSVFTDAIPDGTKYVPGSIKVTKNGTKTSATDAIDGDIGDFQNNKVTVRLGDIPNTNNAPEGFTVQFKVKALSGNIGKVIINKAQVQYQDLLGKMQVQTETNVVENEIVLTDPVIESEKTAKNLQNKKNEVGDEIEYTIKTRNTISDSLVKNLVIADTLPEGLEYVPDTLQVDGKTVTDVTDTDNGQVDAGKVNGKLGDVTDTEWHTVVFHAKIKEGQAGKTITNTADVRGDNVPPQEPTAKIPVQSLGQIEIEKVDAADSNVKLKNAVFQILDKDGKEFGKLTTGENGKVISEPLRFGKYTLKEIQAPNGYMLLRDPIEVEVSSLVQKIKVENTKNGWDIPNTGGMGTTIFYLIGTILMLITLVLFLHKRARNN